MSSRGSALISYLLSLMHLVLVWRGISQGWEPASSVRSRSDAERFCSLLRKVRGDLLLYKVATLS